MVELFPTNAHLEMHDIVEIDTNSKLEMWSSNIYIYIYSKLKYHEYFIRIK